MCVCRGVANNSPDATLCSIMRITILHILHCTLHVLDLQNTIVVLYIAYMLQAALFVSSSLYVIHQELPCGFMFEITLVYAVLYVAYVTVDYLHWTAILYAVL